MCQGLSSSEMLFAFWHSAFSDEILLREDFGFKSVPLDNFEENGNFLPFFSSSSSLGK